MEEDFSALIQKAIAEAKEANEKRNPTLLPAEEKSETEKVPKREDEPAASPPVTQTKNEQRAPLGFLSALEGLLGGNGNDLLLYAVCFMLFKEKSDNDLLLALLYVILGK